jgi:hypothetical protein
MSPAALRQRRRRARLTAVREIEFVRADWALFLHPDRLPQKAGCPRDRLRAMILKELVDNALDAGANTALDQIGHDTWVVTDDGPGLDREQVVRLFAVNRLMTSTKLVRRPTRGAIGNGLRVVTGGVLASGGTLQVESRCARYVLDVDRSTGQTLVLEETESDVSTGTRVTIGFGSALPGGADDGWMARLALRCAGPAAQPMRSHASWYDKAAFAELTHAAEPGATVADIAALLGVQIDDGRPATEADLEFLKVHAGAPPALVPLGAERFPGSYAKERSGAGRIAILAEAWATAERCPPSRGRGQVTLLVNRSPTAAPIRITPSSEGRLAIFGCNLAHGIDRVSSGGAYEVVLAVTSPVVPVTTEGKEPDLRPLWGEIEPALAKAMRAAHRSTGSGVTKGDIKSACYEVMEEAYLKASGNNRWPANARQIFYVARPLVFELLGPEVELKDKYFTQVLLPDYVTENPEITADWDVVYDARGHIVEPHTGLSMPVGTIQVRDYLLPRRQRPGDLVMLDTALWPTMGAENRFSTLLYIEKEGFEPLLQKARIPERFDCAVMSTKGMSVTAARLLVDRMAQQGVKILVAHDFDRAGATIAYTLGHDTRRYEFEVAPDVIDLGLGLDEAVVMGLQDEAAPDAGPREEKLQEYGLGREAIDFLIHQQRRVELNAMTSDQFVAWLERKLDEHGAGKVVPSGEVLEQHARRLLARQLAEDRAAALAQELQAETAGAELPPDLSARVKLELDGNPELPWEDALAEVLAVSRSGQLGDQGDQDDPEWGP